MKDPYLEAMLSGERSPQKSRFDLALKEYLDTLTFEPSDLLTAQAKREKLENELKESFTHSELKHQLSKAIQIVKKSATKQSLTYLTLPPFLSHS